MSSGYVPPPPAQYGSVQPASPPRSSSKKIVWIVVSIVLALAVLFMLFIGGIIYGLFSSIKSSEPYKHAVDVATHDPRVLSTLGPPVKERWYPGGTVNMAGDSGNAVLIIPVQGTLRKGALYVGAKKSDGVWTYQTLGVRLDDTQERIDLLRPPVGRGHREK
jgi:Cytochrome oxidase complex assembly protein 1